MSAKKPASEKADTARRCRDRWRAANLEKARAIARAHYHSAKGQASAIRHRQTAGYRLKRLERQDAVRRMASDRAFRLKMKACMDCGFFPVHPAQMHFDHRDPSTKVGSVSWLMQKGEAGLMAEIAKCDLVCANCHAVRTQAQWAARGDRRGSTT